MFLRAPRTGKIHKGLGFFIVCFTYYWYRIEWTPPHFLYIDKRVDLHYKYNYMHAWELTHTHVDMLYISIYVVHIYITRCSLGVEVY